MNNVSSYRLTPTIQKGVCLLADATNYIDTQCVAEENMPEEKVEKTAEAPKTGGKDVEENKVWAAIGYLGILFLLPLLAKKDSPFAQYHGKQGLALFVAGFIIGVASAIPFIGWVFISPFCSILLIILFIMGLINALTGKMQPLPVIGKMVEGLKI